MLLLAIIIPQMLTIYFSSFTNHVISKLTS